MAVRGARWIGCCWSEINTILIQIGLYIVSVLINLVIDVIHLKSLTYLCFWKRGGILVISFSGGWRQLEVDEYLCETVVSLQLSFVLTVFPGFL